MFSLSRSTRGRADQVDFTAAAHQNHLRWVSVGTGRAHAEVRAQVNSFADDPVFFLIGQVGRKLQAAECKPGLG